MGRKTNSIGLRLKKTNKDYIHCWYGDILYNYNFENSVKISKILSSILQTVDIPCPQFSFTGGYKKTNLLLCYLESTVKNKASIFLSLPISSNKINLREKKSCLENRNISPPKGFLKGVDQGSFFETFILKQGQTQAYNVFQGPAKKQKAYQKSREAPTRKHLRGGIKIEPGKFKGYTYRGALGINCNRERIEPLYAKVSSLCSIYTDTETGQPFTPHFWPLLYNSENSTLYQFQSSSKKPQKCVFSKTKTGSVPELQASNPFPIRFSPSPFQYGSNSQNSLQSPTFKNNSKYIYNSQGINFKPCHVFFEICTLGKTTGLVFGNPKASSCKRYIEDKGLASGTHYKQGFVASHLNLSLERSTFNDFSVRASSQAFAKQKQLEKGPLEQQFYEKSRIQPLGLQCDFVVNKQVPPKLVLDTWHVEKQNYINSVYGNIKGFLGKGVSIFFVKSLSEKASALFLAHWVCYFLERKVLFRRIKRQLLYSLQPSKKVNPWGFSEKTEKGQKTRENLKVCGLRVSCSGRVGGRSKKAQRSRKETFMWGETGLHVFSNSLDFAQTYAETSFGTVGIQVWVCYK